MYYLYVKQHNKTLKKYLGKTEQNPDKYQGSGLHWKRHIKKHGNDVSTYIIGTYETEDQLKENGLFYSKIWDVAKSSDWANLKPEEGDGGLWTFTEQQKRKMSIAKLGKPQPWNKGRCSPFKGKTHSLETKEAIRILKSGVPLSESHKQKIKQSSQYRTKEHRQKISLANRGKNAWNKGISYKINKTSISKGRTYEEIYGPEKAKELKEKRRSSMKLMRKSLSKFH